MAYFFTSNSTRQGHKPFSFLHTPFDLHLCTLLPHSQQLPLLSFSPILFSPELEGKEKNMLLSRQLRSSHTALLSFAHSFRQTARKKPSCQRTHSTPEDEATFVLPRAIPSGLESCCMRERVYMHVFGHP